MLTTKERKFAARTKTTARRLDRTNDPAGSKENSPETFKTEEEIYYGS